MTRPRGNFRWRRWFWLGLVVLLRGWVTWSWWGEYHPEQERELRVRVHEQLQEWFPEQMALSEGQYGFLPRIPQASETGRPDVVLLHGLDEPGDIWDDLIPVLAEAGWVAWEFRYPNDQAIDASVDFLAEAWLELPADLSVVLVGHSMGGLVARDFVGRWRHPVEVEPQVAGASVCGVILGFGCPHPAEQRRASRHPDHPGDPGRLDQSVARRRDLAVYFPWERCPQVHSGCGGHAVPCAGHGGRIGGGATMTRGQVVDGPGFPTPAQPH